MKKTFIKIVVVSILSLFCVSAYYGINSYLSGDKEITQLKKILDKVHHSIKYGAPKKLLLFKDEILKCGKGHCGHLSRLLIFDLLKMGYNNFDIVSVVTYNKRNHSLVQLRLKNSSKTILIDPTTDIIYLHSLGQLLDNPSLCRDITDKSLYPNYSNMDFWSTIQNIVFIPYLDGLVIKPDVAYIRKNNMFSKSEYILKNLFDGVYGTYINIHVKSKKSIDIIAEFNNTKRISSIVIYPYNMQNYPFNLSILCTTGLVKKKIFDGKIHLKRGMIIVNLYNGPYCDAMTLSFSHLASNALLLRDIYIYGK